MWNYIKPGGGILWYDFIYNNPQNPNVEKVTLKNIKELFPDAQIKSWRLTLGPPISRLVIKVHLNFYHVFNLFHFFAYSYFMLDKKVLMLKSVSEVAHE